MAFKDEDMCLFWCFEILAGWDMGIFCSVEYVIYVQQLMLKCIVVIWQQSLVFFLHLFIYLSVDQLIYQYYYLNKHFKKNFMLFCLNFHWCMLQV